MKGMNQTKNLFLIYPNFAVDREIFIKKQHHENNGG